LRGRPGSTDCVLLFFLALCTSISKDFYFSKTTARLYVFVLLKCTYNAAAMYVRLCPGCKFRFVACVVCLSADHSSPHNLV
jgi:hypothetical protein